MFADDLDDYEQRPEIAGEADTEYQTRIEAQRVTLQFGQKSNRRLDSGKCSMEDSPLMGGPRQGDLFSA